MNSEIKDKGHFKKCKNSVHEVKEVLLKKVDGWRRELDELKSIQVPDPKMLKQLLSQLNDQLTKEDFKQSDQYATWEDFYQTLQAKLSKMEIGHYKDYQSGLEKAVRNLETNKEYLKQEKKFNELYDNLKKAQEYISEVSQYKFLINYERQLNHIKSIAKNFDNVQNKTIQTYLEISMALNNYELNLQLSDFINYINFLSTVQDKKNNWKVLLNDAKSYIHKSDYDNYSVLIIIFKALEQDEYYYAQIEKRGEVSVNIFKLSQNKLYCQSKNRIEAKEKLETLGFTNPTMKLIKQPLSQETLIEQICISLQLNSKRLTKKVLEKVSYFQQLLGLTYCDQFLLENLVQG